LSKYVQKLKGKNTHQKMNENLQNEDAEKWKFVIKMEICDKNGNL